MNGRNGVNGGVKKRKMKSQSQRARLVFPVARVHRYLRQGNYTPRIGASACVYLTAVLEYLCAELLELTGQAAAANNRMRITPRHITLVIRQDDELDTLLDRVIISGGGVIPHIRSELLPRKPNTDGKYSDNTQ